MLFTFNDYIKSTRGKNRSQRLDQIVKNIEISFQGDSEKIISFLNEQKERSLSPLTSQIQSHFEEKSYFSLNLQRNAFIQYSPQVQTKHFLVSGEKTGRKTCKSEFQTNSSTGYSSISNEQLDKKSKKINFKYFKEAIQMFQTGNVKEAHNKLKYLLETSEQESDSQLYLYFTFEINLFRQTLEALFSSGSVLQNQTDCDKYSKLYTDIILQNQTSDSSYLNFTMIYYQLKLAGKAEDKVRFSQLYQILIQHYNSFQMQEKIKLELQIFKSNLIEEDLQGLSLQIVNLLLFEPKQYKKIFQKLAKYIQQFEVSKVTNQEIFNYTLHELAANSHDQPLPWLYLILKYIQLMLKKNNFSSLTNANQQFIKLINNQITYKDSEKSLILEIIIEILKFIIDNSSNFLKNEIEENIKTLYQIVNQLKLHSEEIFDLTIKIAKFWVLQKCYENAEISYQFSYELGEQINRKEMDILLIRIQMNILELQLKQKRLYDDQLEKVINKISIGKQVNYFLRIYTIIVFRN